jgi:thiamine monophosphate kinase
LVYVQFNLKLLSRREKIKSKKLTNVLLSSDTTETQGFLLEGGDDFTLVEFRDGEEEDAMEGAGIAWSVIGEAMGAEEQLERRRSARVRQLYDGEEFESEEEEYDEDEKVVYSEEEI